MTNKAFKLSAIALCATAFAAFAPLSAGAATAEMRPPGAAGISTHAGDVRALHGMMVRRTGGTAHAAASFHGGRQFISTAGRPFYGRSHIANRDYVYGRYGDRGRFGYRHGYGVAGVGAYPYYSGGYYAYGYGSRRHSCWWYRHFDPAGIPTWCGTYGYTYGYEPSYVYGYGGPVYGYGYTYGTYGRRYGYGPSGRRYGTAGFGRPNFAFHGGVTRPMEGRAALVGGAPNGARFQSGPHNVGVSGVAHLGGGAAHMGGSAHIGGHLNQH